MSPDSATASGCAVASCAPSDKHRKTRFAAACHTTHHVLPHRHDLIERQGNHDQHGEGSDEAQRAIGADYDRLDDDEKNRNTAERHNQNEKRSPSTASFASESGAHSAHQGFDHVGHGT